MRFNSAVKGVKIVKNPGNGRLNNLNDLVLNVLIQSCTKEKYGGEELQLRTFIKSVLGP